MSNPFQPFDLNAIPAVQSFGAADQQLAAVDAYDLQQNPKFLATIYNNAYGALGILGDYLTCEPQWRRNGVGTCTITLKGDDEFGPVAMTCAATVVPITVVVNGMQWSGRVDTCSWDDVDGIQSYTLNCKSDYDWFNHILVWPNFLFPLEVQFPTQAVFCLGRGTGVLVREGSEDVYRPIESLTGSSCTVVVNGSPHSATASWSNGVKAVYSLVTESGSVLQLTADHRLLTPAGWRKAQDIGVGGEVVTDYDGRDRIASFEPAGEMEVYDLHVPGMNRFVANGIVAHNCGPAITNLKELIAEQCIRLQLGLWEIINNIYDPAAWFATTMVDEGLLTPIAVVPSNPLTDTSPWIAVTCQMDTVATIAEQILKSTGMMLTAELWLPGDPQPPGLTLVVATIVVDVKDYSGVTGPTGTVIDGLLVDVATLLTGAYAEVALPLNGTAFLPPGVVIDPALGINWTPPTVIYYPDSKYSGVKEVHVTAHHPLAYTVISGGKSPAWVNDLINLALEAFMSLIIAGIAEIPGLSGVAAAAGFADNLLDGILNNVVLAWDELENAPRRIALGTYGFPEYPTAIGSTAWTLQSAMSLLNGQFDSRGWVSAQMVVTDAYPYRIGIDFAAGNLVSFVHNNIVYSDYVDLITASDTRDERWQVAATIGDGQAEESPLSVIQRRITGLQAALSVSLLSSN